MHLWEGVVGPQGRMLPAELHTYLRSCPGVSPIPPVTALSRVASGPSLPCGPPLSTPGSEFGLSLGVLRPHLGVCPPDWARMG